MEFFSLFSASKAPQPLAPINEVGGVDGVPVVPVNRRAFDHVSQAAHDMHHAALPGVGARFKELGYTHRDLERVLEYIALKAPLVIHVNFERNAEAFARDTHYRNVFEVNKTPYSNENPRVDKENKLFNRIYDSVEASDRPKYGCLNFLSSPDGVKRAAQSYGYDFLTLRSTLRQGHVTVTHGNSQSNSAEMLGTLCYFGHLLLRFTDGEIADVLRAVGRGESKPFGGSSDGLSSSSQGYSSNSNGELSNYREIQLHCPIRSGKRRGGKVCVF